jgi:hypothetical protein
MPNFLKAKRIEIFIIIVVIALFGVVYAFTRTAKAPITDTQQQASQNVAANGVSYAGMDGRNALDLLKVFHKVDTKDTSFGPMIVGIDGVTPDSTHYWAFYVNGKLADVGANSYITKNSDTIEWKLESQ